MRILLVSPYFPPRNAIGALRVHAFARHWAAEGEQVTVLTTVKREYQRGLDLPCDGFEVVEVDYRIPRVLESLRNRLRPRTAGGGAAPRRPAWRAMRRVLTRIQEHTGIWGSMRMPDFTDRWIAPAIDWARRQPPWEVVVSSAGPYTAHLVALAIKRESRAARWVAEYRDLWVGNPLHRGLFPFTLRERRLERQCLQWADLLVTVSEPLARALGAKARLPVEVIYNGFDPVEPSSLPPERIFPDDGLVRL